MRLRSLRNYWKKTENVKFEPWTDEDQARFSILVKIVDLVPTVNIIKPFEFV